MTDINTRGDGLKSVPQSDSMTESMESLLGQAADDFTQRLNRGEQPDIEEYVGCVSARSEDRGAGSEDRGSRIEDPEWRVRSNPYGDVYARGRRQ